MQLIAVLLLVVVFVPLVNNPAQARYATGGQGLYKDSIDWFEWGAAGTKIADGTSLRQTNTRDLGGGVTLNTTCEVSNIVTTSPTDPVTPSGKGLETYRPGSWYGDALDELYNVGGTGTANQLVSGLITGVGPVVVGQNERTFQTNLARFTFSCQATVTDSNGSRPVPLNGLVFADAESTSAGGSVEYIQAQPLGTTTAKWHLIDRARVDGCATYTNAQMRTGQTLRLQPNNLQCADLVSGGWGPTAVSFLEGATSASVEMFGQGRTAIALGVMLPIDGADAPQSYGAASALMQPAWQPGTSIQASPYATNVFTATLSKSLLPKTRLGTDIDSNGDQRYSVEADGDDLSNRDDEDGWTPPVGGITFSYANTAQHVTSTKLAPSVYSTSVTCTNNNATGKGLIAGWIDWNGNGTFDSDERSNTVACPYTSSGSSSVTLAWTVPSYVKNQPKSYVRLRMADTASELTPTGLSMTGEVEDYPVAINTPKQNLVVDKYWVVDGKAPVKDGAQPAWLSAKLSVSGPQGATASSLAWGAYRDGYRDGEVAALSEQVTIAPQFVGCRVVSQQVTKVNDVTVSGQTIGDTATPFNLTISDKNTSTGEVRKTNTVEVTNTVACDTKLQLVKSVDPNGDGQVFGDGKPQDWTLTATSTDASAATTGTTTVSGRMPNESTPVTGNITANAVYTLSENNARPHYAQQGAWTCATATGRDAQGNIQFGASQPLTNAQLKAAAGTVTRCTVTNETAKLTVLKEVPDTVTSFTPADFVFTVDPGTNAVGLAETQLVGAAEPTAANTTYVRPGSEYSLTESATNPDLAYVNTAVEKLDTNGNWVAINPASIKVPAGEHWTIRYVNTSPGTPALPLTGGFTGMLPFIGSGSALGILALAAWYTLRRKPANALLS